ncbi:MAG: LptF/LptG family permease [Bacteroidales bacterium]|nr:LptF/LptG family permease [Bacteroidales bacterium]
MRLKKIHLLVLKSYLGPFVLTFFIALFILLMQFLWKYVDDLVGKGLEWYVIMELLFYASSTFVPMALPLAILLASLMTMGNLGERYELAAMKAAGVSLLRTMRPLIVASILISVAAFYFSNNVLPVANLKFQSLLYDVRKQKLALNIKEGIYYNGIDGFTIRLGKKEANGNRVKDVMIYDHTDKKGNTTVTIADSGRMALTPNQQELIFTLYSGQTYDEEMDRHNRTKRPFQRMEFREQFRRFDLSGFELNRTNEELFRNNYQMLNLEQLEESRDSIRKIRQKKMDHFKESLIKNYYFLTRMDTLDSYPDTVSNFNMDFIMNFRESNQNRIIDRSLGASRNIKNNIHYNLEYFKRREELLRKHRVEWHRKFTLSFACFVLFFIGAPLGAIIRKGGLGLPLIISILFFVLWHVTSMSGEKAIRAGAMEPVTGMWLSSAILLPLGILITIKATTDSPLLDLEAYGKTYNKIKRKLIKKR